MPAQPLGEYQPFFTLNRKYNPVHVGLQENSGYPLAAVIPPPRQHPGAESTAPKMRVLKPSRLENSHPDANQLCRFSFWPSALLVMGISYLRVS